MISVIIPVYNHASVLGRCLASLAEQTLLPGEVIVVDDGSTDDFEKIAAEISKDEKFKNLNIKIIRQQNRGAGAARNRGFAESTGELVIFWDADTIACPEMLEKMKVALDANSVASFAYGQFKFGWKTMKSRPFDAVALKKENYIDTTSLLRRTDFSGFDESLKRFQDWDLWLALLEKNKTGVFVPEVLFKKLVAGRKGMSHWQPSFFYRLPWKSKAVKDYEAAKEIVRRKHGLA